MRILAGLETEYGLDIGGRSAENQVEDAQALVRSYPGKRFSGWDYRFESPRADLRGFRLDRLAVDPDDARFDVGRPAGSDQEIRADQVLANGARFYNDHGHPEYATPECASLRELALHDQAGEVAVARAGEVLARASGREVRLYKNNTDFHGASYGTHESYLVPREFGFEALYRAVTPILIARQLLCGAGKVGSEAGPECDFQLSQRADFLTEAASAETLYRRPVFNTRDEPHADPARWARLHVIAGDANMIPSATRRKAGLAMIALALLAEGEPPHWAIPHPAEAFRAVSRDPRHEGPIELEGRSWTTAAEVLESYFAAAETTLGIRAGIGLTGLKGELAEVIAESRMLLEALTECPERFRMHVDWAAKRWMIEQVMEAEGGKPGETALRAYDLEYHRIPAEEGLYDALAADGQVEPRAPSAELEARLEAVFEPTRARARSLAVSRFGDRLRAASWRRLVFDLDGQDDEVELPPEAVYPESLTQVDDVESFVATLRNLT